MPNAPSAANFPATNCDNPNLPLGLSVGWGDQYDQADPGQPISLTGVADGTYILHSMVDPNHVLAESNPTNNVTADTMQTWPRRRISGTWWASKCSTMGVERKR